MTKLSNIITEGKVNYDGIKLIEQLIEENKRLKDSFGYEETYSGEWGLSIYNTFHTKEDVISKLNKSSENYTNALKKALGSEINDLKISLQRESNIIESIKKLSLLGIIKWWRKNKHD